MYRLFISMFVTLWLVMPAKADGFLSTAQIYELAATVNVISAERRQLGIDWAGPQERHFSLLFRRPWSCVNIPVITENGGRFRAALCMPKTCRSLHPLSVISFRPALQESARQGWNTVAFVTDQQTQRVCDRAHRARGIRGEGWQRRSDRPKW